MKFKEFLNEDKLNNEEKEIADYIKSVDFKVKYMDSIVGDSISKIRDKVATWVFSQAPGDKKRPMVDKIRHMDIFEFNKLWDVIKKY